MFFGWIIDLCRHELYPNQLMIPGLSFPSLVRIPTCLLTCIQSWFLRNVLGWIIELCRQKLYPNQLTNPGLPFPGLVRIPTHLLTCIRSWFLRNVSGWIIELRRLAFTNHLSEQFWKFGLKLLQRCRHICLPVPHNSSPLHYLTRQRYPRSKNW
jgi:hypothetical protein